MMSLSMLSAEDLVYGLMTNKLASGTDRYAICLEGFGIAIGVYLHMADQAINRIRAERSGNFQGCTLI